MTEKTNARSVAAAVEQQRVISVLRGTDGGRVLEIAEAVLEGGIKMLKIAMTTPGAAAILETLAVRHGDSAVLGAGSVTTMGETTEMIAGGARFIVCPHTDRRIIDYCRDNDVFVAAGGLTPTEVMEAYLAGVDLVKVYPVKSVGGPEYIRYLLRPMPFLRLMPVGGLDPDDVADYIRAGSVAVGASALPLHSERAELVSMEEIRDRAQAFLQVVRNATN
ncbi:MAG TPA: bifunctional 4-hydroxy-2-oxoglutarate aldolase/2-dehydro-3-deoxy-phosphogluconate aldolase [Acidobacteriota bacterium]|nr:bifunctional 4-hydroxy-2-oxoglutarate aldolase/2-dehydro-3-deoxy-phosphogluconate aldolase [Acidobacteriota bacterium]